MASKDDDTIINFSRPSVPELPIRTTTKILTQTEGRGLKQNTRANKGLIEGVMFGYPWVQRWQDNYVQSMLDDLMSLAISVEGQGRRDMIDSLEAGGKVPDAYYTSGESPRRGETAYLRRED